MSEQKELQKGVAESKVRTRVEELSKYLDGMSVKIEEAIAREKGSWLIYGVGWGSWLAVGFLRDPSANNLMELIFIMTIFYQGYCRQRTAGLIGEFMGAIRTLEILGFLPPTISRGNRKKKRLWSEGADLVKRWAASKKMTQEKVYAPA